MGITIKVNGTDHEIDADGDTPLLWVLRDVLGMTGTKFGCGMALCGACTVHLEGAAIRFCITTVDSIGDPEQTCPVPLNRLNIASSSVARRPLTSVLFLRYHLLSFKVGEILGQIGRIIII
jgi:hypothetical protein